MRHNFLNGCQGDEKNGKAVKILWPWFGDCLSLIRSYQSRYAIGADNNWGYNFDKVP